MHLLSDFCNRVNIACKVSLKKVLIKNNKIVLDSIFLLYKLGYIFYFTIKNYKFVIVFLKYNLFGSVIRGLVVLSKPSLRYYLKYKNILKFSFNNNFGMIGFMALSTNSRKVVLDFDCVSNSMGGEPIWAVY